MTRWSADCFLDAHSHNIDAQAGGLLIGLEGTPKLENTVDNAQAFEAARSNSLVLPIFYVARDLPETDSLALKYHARREGFTPQGIIMDLRRRGNSRLVVLDTLNEPNWDYRDYWTVVKSAPDKQFVLAHAGGLDIQNFIKIVMFEPNVWMDFSFTQTLFGFTVEELRHAPVCDAIRYCLDSPRIRDKVFFGSDNPFVDQTAAAAAFAREPAANALLGGNLMRLYDMIGR